MTHQLLQYSYLQVLDLLSTLAFLRVGVEEGNPLVRWVIESAPTYVSGLLLIKLVALAVGIYCWQAGRERLLSRVNIGFALLVVWNLVSLVVKSTTLV